MKIEKILEEIEKAKNGVLIVPEKDCDWRVFVEKLSGNNYNVEFPDHGETFPPILGCDLERVKTEVAKILPVSEIRKT